MSKNIVTVGLMRSGVLSGDRVAAISENLLRKWGGPRSVTLRFGAFKSSVELIPIRKSGQLRLSEGLAARMGITQGASLRITYRPSSQTVSIGPLIGVIVSRAFPHLPDRPFGSITAWCREVAEASRQQGAFVYFFPPGGIVEDNGTVEGWTFAGGWWRRSFPVPDVLHNRLTARKLENQSSVQKLFKDAKARYGTQVFNEKYLDKTEVFTALQREASLQKYLPESHAFKGLDMLKFMTDKYRTVFLKPVRGSLGKGIIRVTRAETGGYACYFSELNGTRKVSYPTIAKVYSSLAPRMKARRFQIQQGLKIATVNGRPVDFRALVQKGLAGAWDITSIVGRIAGPNHFVSNVAKGGTMLSAKAAIARSNIPPGRRGAGLAGLRNAALGIAKGLESSIDAHFGELGIDLALDQAGRVWLLEVNSKPSKNDNTQLTASKIRPSVKMLVHYARHLTKM